MQTLDNPEVMVRAVARRCIVRVDPTSRPSEAARQFVGLTIPDLARECCGAGISTARAWEPTR